MWSLELKVLQPQREESHEQGHQNQTVLCTGTLGLVLQSVAGPDPFLLGTGKQRQTWRNLWIHVFEEKRGMRKEGEV